LIRKKKCNVTYFIVKRTSNFKSLIMSGAAATIKPARGGIHPIYGVYLVGGEVQKAWLMGDHRYRFSTQRRDEKNVTRVERGLTDARDKTMTLKFNGNLELDGKQGSENELDKDHFVRTIFQLTREHGHQAFYAVEDTGGFIADVNQNLHLFSINDVIDCHNNRMNTATTDASKYDLYERDEIDLTRLVVESRLTEKMRDAIRTRYDHDPLFYDYPVPVIFMMALVICNASQSYDIEGAQKKLDELTLDSYPGEDVTACTAFAQKQFKLIQTGCAPPFRSGSKLLLKFCGTECEQFNRQVYAKLDLVKSLKTSTS
jgi:hypothetical protein